jgi:hypothetical protein
VTAAYMRLQSQLGSDCLLHFYPKARKGVCCHSNAVTDAAATIAIFVREKSSKLFPTNRGTDHRCHDRPEVIEDCRGDHLPSTPACWLEHRHLSSDCSIAAHHQRGPGEHGGWRQGAAATQLTSRSAGLRRCQWDPTEAQGGGLKSAYSSLACQFTGTIA